MPEFPSSQTKAKKTSLDAKIAAAMARVPHRRLTLYGKVQKLRQLKSDDPIVQLQSEILSDLYDQVWDLDVMINPLLLSLPRLTWTG